MAIILMQENSGFLIRGQICWMGPEFDPSQDLVSNFLCIVGSRILECEEC
jgi:hypothetical protein